tara:strand:+ start:11013 stop:11351 length:339 start_codon:yes stop_codon:yes gene_type:complete
MYKDKDKEKFLELLSKNAGNVSRACKAMNINRRTFYNWMDKEESFRFVVEEIQESLIDDAESELQKLIKDGNTAAILFFLKTKAKARGYIERQEQDITSKGEKISININLDE